VRPNEDLIGCQRRGLLESHAMSEAHKQAYEKYLAFVDRMHFNTELIKTNHIDKPSGKRKRMMIFVKYHFFLIF
jgi:hypothetical protein